MVGNTENKYLCCGIKAKRHIGRGFEGFFQKYFTAWLIVSGIAGIACFVANMFGNIPEFSLWQLILLPLVIVFELGLIFDIIAIVLFIAIDPLDMKSGINKQLHKICSPICRIFSPIAMLIALLSRKIHALLESIYSGIKMIYAAIAKQFTIMLGYVALKYTNWCD